MFDSSSPTRKLSIKLRRAYVGTATFTFTLTTAKTKPPKPPLPRYTSHTNNSQLSLIFSNTSNPMSTHDPLATEVASYDAMYTHSPLLDQRSALTISSTKRNQEQSPLLRLPAELRNRIFGYVVGPPTLVYLGYNLCGRLRISRAYMRVKRIGQTSRQIRAETHLRFLRQNVLQFKRQTFKRCMRTFTAEEQNAIRRVRVYETEALGRPLGCGQAFTAEEQNAIRRVRLCQMEARE